MFIRIFCLQWPILSPPKILTLAPELPCIVTYYHRPRAYPPPPLQLSSCIPFQSNHSAHCSDGSDIEPLWLHETVPKPKLHISKAPWNKSVHTCGRKNSFGSAVSVIASDSDEDVVLPLVCDWLFCYPDCSRSLGSILWIRRGREIMWSCLCWAFLTTWE